MPGRNLLVVVGASAGGVEALQNLVGHLPADFPGSVFVVLHVPAHGTSLLPAILSRKGPLPAVHPVDGEAIEPGRIYVAPPDLHLLVDDGRVRLSRGPRENGHRPAVDTLFRTAARWRGSRVAGVVLSGTLDDGTAGLAAVKRRGGLALVQDPDEALYPGMPRNAIEHVAIDYVGPIAELAARIDRLAREPYPAGDDDPSADDPELEMEAEMAEMDPDAMHQADRPGTPSGFGCPDCGGALWEFKDGDLERYRCRVGHAWTSNGLLVQQGEALEGALWSALRALEERAALSGKIAERLRGRGHALSAAKFDEQAAESRRLAEVVRVELTRVRPPDEGAPAPPAGPTPVAGR